MCLNHVPCSESLPTPLLNVMPMGNKPRVDHRLLPHTTMSMRDKSLIDESHPMIILKAKVICFLNQNFWMSYSNDHFFYKTKCLRLHMPSYTLTGFHRWKRINHIYRVFHRRGYLSLLPITRHIFSHVMQPYDFVGHRLTVPSPPINHQTQC